MSGSFKADPEVYSDSHNYNRFSGQGRARPRFTKNKTNKETTKSWNDEAALVMALSVSVTEVEKIAITLKEHLCPRLESIIQEPERKRELIERL